MGLIITLIILNLLIFFHELGHYLAARMARVHVKEFAIGFGKKIFSFEKNNTIYSLRLIPIGGFCALQGMVKDDLGKEGSNFIEKSILWRMLILASGSLMNLFIAIVVFSITYMIFYDAPIFIAFVGGIETTRLVIQEILSVLANISSNIDNFTGPVGIVSIISGTIGNLEMLSYIIALISINLGIMNLLPLPGLDGGRILFLIFEALRKKEVKPEKETWVHGVGLLLLLVLLILITYKDIVNIL